MLNGLYDKRFYFNNDFIDAQGCHLDNNCGASTLEKYVLRIFISKFRIRLWEYYMGLNHEKHTAYSFLFYYLFYIYKISMEFCKPPSLYI